MEWKACKLNILETLLVSYRIYHFTTIQLSTGLGLKSFLGVVFLLQRIICFLPDKLNFELRSRPNQKNEIKKNHQKSCFSKSDVPNERNYSLLSQESGEKCKKKLAKKLLNQTTIKSDNNVFR